MRSVSGKQRTTRTPRGRTAATAVLPLLMGAAAGGCTNALETGYVPRTLGTTATERRGYYASPFTPEAAAAAQAQSQNQSDPGGDVRSMRRPGGGFGNP